MRQETFEFSKHGWMVATGQYDKMRKEQRWLDLKKNFKDEIWSIEFVNELWNMFGFVFTWFFLTKLNPAFFNFGLWTLEFYIMFSVVKSIMKD